MPSTPRAIGRAKALTAGTMLAAAVATGAVAVHLADAETTTAAASTAPSDDAGPTSDEPATTSDDSSTSDDDDSSDDDSTSSSSSGTSGTTSNGFSAPGPVAPAQAPAQSSTNGS